MATYGQCHDELRQIKSQNRFKKRKRYEDAMPETEFHIGDLVINGSTKPRQNADPLGKALFKWHALCRTGSSRYDVWLLENSEIFM